MAMEESQVQKAFVGATVLLTGGTGFIGKLLIDKLLRSCSDLKKLYLIIRPKKNKDPKTRLQEQFNDVLYDRLRKERPDFLHKIRIVEGEMSEKNLCISEEDRQMLINEVNFIFHGAATVRFDEPLKKAVLINVRGTREMLTLARSCAKLKAFVHISTAYNNCLQDPIEEKFYKVSLDSEKLIDLVENVGEDMLNTITPGLLGGYPNTYTYTKAAGEDVLLKNCEGLPVAVFRPATVVPTAKEPVSGWIDNVYGPTGVVIGSAVGLLRVLNCDANTKADLVPGDMVVNACIAIAWKTALDYPGNHQYPAHLDQHPRVYNYAPSEKNRVNWGDYKHYNMMYGLQIPFAQAIWHYILILTPSPYLSKLYSLLLHWIPAYIADAVAVAIGKKPQMKTVYRKIEKLSKVLEYFGNHNFNFTLRNILELFNQLPDADKELFNFNIDALEWDKYFYDHIRGIRLYMAKETLDTVPEGLKWRFRFRIIHYTVVSTLCVALFFIFMWIYRSFFTST